MGGFESLSERAGSVNDEGTPESVYARACVRACASALVCVRLHACVLRHSGPREEPDWALAGTYFDNVWMSFVHMRVCVYVTVCGYVRARVWVRLFMHITLANRFLAGNGSAGISATRSLSAGASRNIVTTRQEWPCRKRRSGTPVLSPFGVNTNNKQAGAGTY